MKIDIPAERAKHAIVGVIVALFAALLFQALGWVQYWRHAAIAAALTAGIVKGLLDWFEARRIAMAGTLPTRGAERAEISFAATLAGGLMIAGVPDAA